MQRSEMENRWIEEAKAYAKQLFSETGASHDAAHTMRVYANAVKIASQETDCDHTAVALAALLHDADDHKLFQNSEEEHARFFLESRGIPEELQEKILTAIRSVSFSKNRGRHPETIEGKIVQDADRLDAMGAIGVARTFAYGGEHGRSLDDSVRHFHEKLLLLKDEMNTETGKQMAEERHAFLLAFLNEYEREMNDMTQPKPDYLYNPEKCPCPRGEKAGCPRYRSCEACVAYHRSNPNTPLTACERKAEQEKS